MTSFLYLLHFDQRLHHAGHYLGSSEHLIARLARHDDGTGARLTQVLVEKGITWHVSGLWVPHQACPLHIREIERISKRRHNGASYCPECSSRSVTPYWTLSYPVQYFYELLAKLNKGGRNVREILCEEL